MKYRIVFLGKICCLLKIIPRVLSIKIRQEEEEEEKQQQKNSVLIKLKNKLPIIPMLLATYLQKLLTMYLEHGTYNFTPHGNPCPVIALGNPRCTIVDECTHFFLPCKRRLSHEMNLFVVVVAVMSVQ